MFRFRFRIKQLSVTLLGFAVATIIQYKMSENGDIEEGEIGDISDFEDGSLGGSRPVSPTNSESMMGVCGSRIATPEHKTPSKCCPDDHFGVRVGFAALNRYGCKASLPQLSDEEVVPHRKVKFVGSNNDKTP